MTNAKYYKVVCNEIIALRLKISNLKVKLEETLETVMSVFEHLEDILQTM